ncbi:hypothetical protein ILUMI_08320, partial [Ignelater luminosus]
SIEDESIREQSLLIGGKLLSALADTASEAIRDCGEPESYDISLSLYTRSNPTHPIKLKLDNVSVVDLRRKTIVLTHGYTSSSSTYLGPNMKDAYLERYDCNLITLDWQLIAFNTYPTAVCLLTKIARIVAGFLCDISNQLKTSLKTVHLGGISLGGQLMGLIGQETKRICKKSIGRITALDPAGPLFQGLPESQRIDRSDADFVQVIHTNKGVLGYFGNCGDADFYPNCGTIQNGCPQINIIEVVQFPGVAATCDHVRSLAYMHESITSDDFKAKSCKSCPEICTPDTVNVTKAIMGEGCSTNTSGAYVLYTNSKAPFAMG